MSEMRYADTNFLIVTCYLLPQGWKCRCAFALASLWLRFRFAPIDGASTDLQRIYNGPGTDLERNCIGRGIRAFLASLHRFLCGVNEFSMMSTKSGLCKPFQETDNLSRYDVNECSIIITKNCKPKSRKNKMNLPQINACCYVIETVGRLYLSLYFCITASFSLS